MIKIENCLPKGVRLVACLAFGLIGAFVTLGCTESPSVVKADSGWRPATTTPVASTLAADSGADSGANEVAEPTTSLQEQTQPATTEQEGGVLKTAGDLFEKAKSGTGATAKGAKDWVQDKLGGASEATGEAADDTMKWATDTFNSLKDKGLTTASNTSEWLSQDWKNMQSWEYKTVTLAEASEGNSVDDQLNKLGQQGWECFHVDGSRFFFKKPADSYLRHIPFKDYIKLVPLLQGK